MGTPTSATERLHALLGDAATQLSPAHIQRIEAKLEQQAGDGVMPMLLTHLQQMQPDQCADGTPWVERRLHAGRCNDMASASRGLCGLATVLRLLHAAQLTREDASGEQHLNNAEIDGLLHAARVLTETASNALHGRP